MPNHSPASGKIVMLVALCMMSEHWEVTAAPLIEGLWGGMQHPASSTFRATAHVSTPGQGHQMAVLNPGHVTSYMLCLFGCLGCLTHCGLCREEVWRLGARLANQPLRLSFVRLMLPAVQRTAAKM